VDIKKYISSGILEQYVLGLASEEERQEVQMYANTFPEIQKELDAVEVVIQKYATLHKLPAPAGVQAKFNKTIDELIAKNPPPSDNGSSGKSGFGGGFLLPIILVGALLGSSWLAFSNYNGKQTAQTNLNTVQEELTTLQTDCDETSLENEALKGRIRILQNPDNQVIKMGGIPTKAPNAIASVIRNNATKKSYVTIQSLPTPPTDKQYQLWAIVDGQPVDMGVFDVVLTENGLQEVPFIENAAAFAVTLENKGGSTAGPTMEEMYVIGNVG